LPGRKNNHCFEPATKQDELGHAAVLLKQGGVVAFPTETCYGLAVDPFNPRALARLFAVKGRPADKPVLVLIEERQDLDLLVSAVPKPYSFLMDRFWPGPLTLVFPARKGLPDLLTAGSGTIAVRCSPHPLARALITRFGGPVTATSANRSGLPGCTTASQVQAAFGSVLDLVLDGGGTPGGAGSTIVCCRDGRLACLRDGQLDFASVLAVYRSGTEAMTKGETMKELLWNREFALEQTAGDEELLEELLALFRDSSAQDYSRLCEAAEAGDADGVVAAAHSIKGAAASLGIEGVRQLALEMESRAREGDAAWALTEKEKMGRLLEACGEL
jgi:L-threonylcarbamoyladenylate synthase